MLACIKMDGALQRCGRTWEWLKLSLDHAGDMERLLKELANKKKELQDAGKM